MLATGAGQLPATIIYSLTGDFAAVNLGLLAGAIAFTFVIATIITISVRGCKKKKYQVG